MSRRKAERFESALQQPAEGDLADLVETARRLEVLAGLPPSPPQRLAPGRQRLLAEAARHRSAQIKRRKEWRPMTGMMKLGTALLALVLLMGLTFGASQAAADSLPGEPLYGFKLGIEEARLALTNAPEAQAALNLALAEERLDEVAALLEQGQPVGAETAARVEQQLQAAFDAAPAGALDGLAVAIQQRQRTMEQLAGDTPDEPLRQIIRVMERVRQEAHAGQGEPDGAQERQRQGTPPEPSAMPPGADHTPGPAGPKATDQPGPGPVGPQPTDQPGGGPGPVHTPEPGGEGGPGGPQATPSPGAGPGPQPTAAQPSPEPGEPNGPGGQPTAQPGDGNSGHGGGENGQGKP